MFARGFSPEKNRIFPTSRLKTSFEMMQKINNSSSSRLFFIWYFSSKCNYRICVSIRLNWYTTIRVRIQVCQLDYFEDCVSACATAISNQMSTNWPIKWTFSKQNKEEATTLMRTVSDYHLFGFHKVPIMFILINSFRLLFDMRLVRRSFIVISSKHTLSNEA